MKNFIEFALERDVELLLEAAENQDEKAALQEFNQKVKQEFQKAINPSNINKILEKYGDNLATDADFKNDLKIEINKFKDMYSKLEARVKNPQRAVVGAQNEGLLGDLGKGIFNLGKGIFNLAKGIFDKLTVFFAKPLVEFFSGISKVGGIKWVISGLILMAFMPAISVIYSTALAEPAGGLFMGFLFVIMQIIGINFVKPLAKLTG